ncbi:MAG: RecQ family ATP-dependent DNA helicase [Pseudomonadota bacterium]
MWRKIQEVMRRYWGFQGFLPLQREAMECVLQGRDSLVVLPTGGGKSLCFQAPAMAMDGPAIVVSPLIALMKDQVDALVEHGIPAAKLDSTMSPTEQSDVIRRIRDGTLKLLYLAPERLVSQRALAFLARVPLSFVAVDEAHCVSMWGHEFRPEYRELGVLKETFQGLPVHAYTATATDRVCADIAVQLRLDNPSIVVGSFFRPNLTLAVERRHNGLKQVCDVLDRRRGESGIVYCIRRRDVDKLAEQLTEKGYRVVPYHAGMSNEERAKNQDAFLKDRIDTIIATVAFGMGIDKSNVSYVIHTGMPS